MQLYHVLWMHSIQAEQRPARIEEVVAKVKKQLDNEIIETGKRTAIDLGIHGLHPDCSLSCRNVRLSRLSGHLWRGSP